MAVNQQSSSNQANADHSGVYIGGVIPEKHHHAISSQNSRQHTSNRANLSLLSFGSSLVAIGLTLMIALIAPGEPVLQRPVETSVGVPDQSVISTIELPSPPVDDKRFMNGLEVEPAPSSASDPFSVRGNKSK